MIIRAVTSTVAEALIRVFLKMGQNRAVCKGGVSGEFTIYDIRFTRVGIFWGLGLTQRRCFRTGTSAKTQRGGWEEGNG